MSSAAKEEELKTSENTQFFVLWANSRLHGFSFEDFAEGSEEVFEKKRDDGTSRSVKRFFDTAKVGDYALGYETGKDKRIVACLSSIVETNADKIVIHCVRHFASPVKLNQIVLNPVFTGSQQTNGHFLKHACSLNNGQGTTMDFLNRNEFFAILKMAGINAKGMPSLAVRDYLVPLDFLKKTSGLVYHRGGEGDAFAKEAAVAKNIFLDLTNAVRSVFQSSFSDVFFGAADNRWQHSGHYQNYYWDPMYLSGYRDEPLCLSITASADEKYSVEIQMTKPSKDKINRAKELCKKLFSTPCPNGFVYGGVLSVLASHPVELSEKIGEAKPEELEGAKIIRVFTRDAFASAETDVTKRNEQIVEALASAAKTLVPLYLRLIGRGDLPESASVPSIAYKSYGKDDFLNDVFVDPVFFDDAIALLHEKMNIILYGAPGVGKTYLAKRLAFADMGSVKSDHIQFVQFHQGYSYEDFVEGYKPNAKEGFDLVPGIFYKFARLARDNPTDSYYLIIDEINRGNISKIFGELLMLVESDKRKPEYSVQLLYGSPEKEESKDDLFYVPANLYLIGMMNSADRSLARMDYALRRRFSFIDVKPAFENGKFVSRVRSFAKDNADSLREIDRILNNMKELNSAIAEDSALGPDFEMGHSYFVPEKDPDLSSSISAKTWLKRLIKYEILPLLKEYAAAGDLSEDVESARQNLEKYLSE